MRMSFAAITRLPEGLFLSTFLKVKVENFYLPCRHTSSVHNAYESSYKK
jgi:hypothetical protein